MMALPLTTELYRFASSSGSWTHTSGQEDVEWGGDTYVATPIGRSAPEATQDISRAQLEVFLPRDNELAADFLRYIGDDVVTVDVFRWDPDAEDYGIFWKGRAVDIATDGDEVALVFESFYTSLRRAGLRARFSKLCRHNVYGEDGCRVEESEFVETLEWTDYTVKILTVPDAQDRPDHWFTGGKLVTQDGSEGYIVRHVGQDIELSRPLSYFEDFLGSGDTVDLYPGCNKTLSQCRNKFDNAPNYGGFPWIPSKNPFGGSSIV